MNDLTPIPSKFQVTADVNIPRFHSTPKARRSNNSIQFGSFDIVSSLNKEVRQESQDQLINDSYPVTCETPTQDSGFCAPDDGHVQASLPSSPPISPVPTLAYETVQWEPETPLMAQQPRVHPLIMANRAEVTGESDSVLDQSLDLQQWVDTFCQIPKTIEGDYDLKTSGGDISNQTKTHSFTGIPGFEMLNTQANAVDSHFPAGNTTSCTATSSDSLSFPGFTEDASILPVTFATIVGPQQSTSFHSTYSYTTQQSRRALEELRANSTYVDPTERPNHSYSDLIKMALQSTPGGQMTLKEIVEWIENHFLYFKLKAKQSWKNSIRHNLSLHVDFVRVEGDRRHGGKWKLTPYAKKFTHRLPKPPVVKPIPKPMIRHSQTSKTGLKPILPKSLSYALVPITLAPHSYQAQKNQAHGQTLLQQHNSQPKQIVPQLLPKTNVQNAIISQNRPQLHTTSTSATLPHQKLQQPTFALKPGTSNKPHEVKVHLHLTPELRHLFYQEQKKMNAPSSKTRAEAYGKGSNVQGGYTKLKGKEAQEKICREGAQHQSVSADYVTKDKDLLLSSSKPSLSRPKHFSMQPMYIDVNTHEQRIRSHQHHMHGGKKEAPIFMHSKSFGSSTGISNNPRRYRGTPGDHLGTFQDRLKVRENSVCDGFDDLLLIQNIEQDELSKGLPSLKSRVQIPAEGEGCSKSNVNRVINRMQKSKSFDISNRENVCKSTSLRRGFLKQKFGPVLNLTCMIEGDKQSVMEEEDTLFVGSEWKKNRRKQVSTEVMSDAIASLQSFEGSKGYLHSSQQSKLHVQQQNSNQGHLPSTQMRDVPRFGAIMNQFKSQHSHTDVHMGDRAKATTSLDYSMLDLKKSSVSQHMWKRRKPNNFSTVSDVIHSNCSGVSVPSRPVAVNTKTMSSPTKYVTDTCQPNEPSFVTTSQPRPKLYRAKSRRKQIHVPLNLSPKGNLSSNMHGTTDQAWFLKNSESTSQVSMSLSEIHQMPNFLEQPVSSQTKQSPKVLMEPCAYDNLSSVVSGQWSNETIFSSHTRDLSHNNKVQEPSESEVTFAELLALTQTPPTGSTPRSHLRAMQPIDTNSPQSLRPRNRVCIDNFTKEESNTDNPSKSSGVMVSPVVSEEPQNSDSSFLNSSIFDNIDSLMHTSFHEHGLPHE